MTVLLQTCIHTYTDTSNLHIYIFGKCHREAITDLIYKQTLHHNVYKIVHSNKAPKLTLGGHFLASTFLSATLFSGQQADKFLQPEQKQELTKLGLMWEDQVYYLLSS